MNSFFKKSLYIILFLFTSLTFAQNIAVISHETFLFDTAGVNTDIAFHFEVVNVSSDTQIVFLKRTINELPFPEPDWTSSLCFGEACFPYFIDSVATDDLINPPLAPNDTLLASAHVFPTSGIGTAYIQVQVSTFATPEDRDTLDFIATTDPTVSVNENEVLNSYTLSQNYPNPFNPSTKIDYTIGESGLVQLKVYNVLGVEVATLVREEKNAGNYSVDFSAANLSSGVYFYTISINNFTQTRKMVLEK
jgi:hypothetical protein